MTCEKCQADDCTALINGWCWRCNPFRRCLDCAAEGKNGTFVNKPTPNWMNRQVCDTCGRIRCR